MRKIVAFNGSPRKAGNTSILLEHFLQGAKNNNVELDEYNTHELNLEYCKGCLRCNMLGYCSIRDDDWQSISSKIMEADVLVFASPIYFHHVSAPLKKVIDRFRSFVQVLITETGLLHTPHQPWQKDFVLLLSMGSSDPVDAEPVLDLFKYMTSILGKDNSLHFIMANRLAVVKQLLKTEEELKILYEKMKLPVYLAKDDYLHNQKTLEKCISLGNTLLKYN